MTVAPTIGSHWSAMMSRQHISPTPAGTKKNPRFLTKKSATLSTHIRRMILSRSAAARSSIPMMLDGIGMPVR